MNSYKFIVCVIWHMWINICHFTYFNPYFMNWQMWIRIFVLDQVNWHMSFHISIRFVWNDIYYFVYYFDTYTNHLPSFCSVLTVLTTIPKWKQRRRRRWRGWELQRRCLESNDGKSIGSFVCEGPEIVDNVGGNCHIHVVMNHNPQEEMIVTTFTGLTSHLAFIYDPPFGPFSKFIYFNLYHWICIMSILI